MKKKVGKCVGEYKMISMTSLGECITWSHGGFKKQ